MTSYTGTLDKEVTARCYVCETLAIDSNLCENCEKSGFWIDPAGGVHHSSDEDEWQDPTEMYR